MQAIISDWQIPGSEGMPIYGTTHEPITGEACGVLLICHGFKGYKDYGFLPQLAEAAAGAGLIAHRFNFSHSGMTRRVETFERPDLFEQDTWSKQVFDLHAVARAAWRGEIAGAGLPMVWFGHSRGGDAVLLAASGNLASAMGRQLVEGDGEVVQPVGLVLAAAPSKATNLDADQRALVRRVGRIASPSARTGQELYIGRPWVEQIEAHPQAHDPVQAAAAVDCPVLIVQGGGDETVPVDAARQLAEASGDRGRLVVIDRASHTFDAPNPLPLDADPPPATRELIELTCRFAREAMA